MIDLASEVLYKEWESLILNMNSCGDIGELDFNELMKSDWLKGNEEVFLAKTISMFERLPECGYASPDAFYVITILAAIASEKLGLCKESAYSFGIGYGFARTGYISYNSLEPKQILFYRIFYPLGKVRNISRYWEVEHTDIKHRIKSVFDSFLIWDNDPTSYKNYYFLINGILDTWKDWNELHD